MHGSQALKILEITPEVPLDISHDLRLVKLTSGKPGQPQAMSCRRKRAKKLHNSLVRESLRIGRTPLEAALLNSAKCLGHFQLLVHISDVVSRYVIRLARS